VVHSIQLVGPGLIALVAVSVLIWAASAYVTIDALRRLRTDYAGVAEGRWFYAVPQAVFFLAFFAWQFPWISTNVPWIGWMVLAVPLVLAQQMGYLLRVVFPTRTRLEKRLEAERAAGVVRPVKGAGMKAARAAARDAEDELERETADVRRANSPGEAHASAQESDFFDDSDDGSSKHA
jgi:hypothetical protein